MPLHSSLPQIEGFQPIPNAVMIPFMEAQSAALAYGFGLNYEFGKRKIRSMSNDEYNSLTSEDITNMTNDHTHIILSKFQLQVPAVMPMQKEIFKQYVVIEKEKILQNVALLKWITANAPQILVEGQTPGSSLKEDVTINEFNKSLNKPFQSQPQSKTIGKPTSKSPPKTSLPAQQQAEKALVMKMLSAQKLIVSQIILMNKMGTPPTKSSPPGTFKQLNGDPNYINAQKAIVKLNIQLKAQSLNLNKKQAEYKNKYGVWLS